MSRYREDDRRLPSPAGQRASYWWNSSQNPKPSPSFLDPMPGWLGEFQAMTDKVVPNFRERSARGEIINNGMNSIKITLQSDATGPVFQKTIGGTTYNGELLGEWPATFTTKSSEARILLYEAGADLPDIPYMGRLAATAALSQVSPSAFTSMVSLAEMRKTLAYVRNPFAQALKLNGIAVKQIGLLQQKIAAQVRGRNTRRALSKLERRMITEQLAVAPQLANIYMELRYAYRPLVKEVFGILEALNGPSQRPERQTFRAVESHLCEGVYEKAESLPNLPYQASYSYNHATTVSVGYLYEQELIVEMAQHWGLDAGSLLPSVWEAIPLSFVWDWFVNVGQFLSAVSPVTGVKQLSSWMTIREQTTIVQRCRGWQFSDWVVKKDGAGARTVSIDTVSRRPGAPRPGLAVHSNVAAGFSRDNLKLVDLAILSFQRMKGLPVVGKTIRI